MFFSNLLTLSNYFIWFYLDVGLHNSSAWFLSWIEKVTPIITISGLTKSIKFEIRFDKAVVSYMYILLPHY